MRITAVQMEFSPDAPSSPPLALLVDDVTDLAELAPEVQRAENRLAETVSAVDAVFWEAEPATWILVIAGALLWVGGIIAHKVGRDGWAFILSAGTLVGAVVFLFWVLFPNVFPASNDPSLSLTIDNASSTEYTLQVMTIVAVIFVPIVLVYQAWTYWIFRKRINADVIPSPDEGSLDYPEERPSVPVG